MADFLSVIVPVYNNATSIDALCERLASSLASFDYEVLFIDDGSRDNSLTLLKRAAASNSRLKVISLSRNFGQHPAIAAGLDHARGDVMILMDADLEDQPENIPSLVRTLETNEYEIVYTIKGGAGRPALDVMSNFYHLIFSRTVGVSLPRQLGTFRAFTRKVLAALRQFPERHVLYGPLMFYVGFRYAIVPVERGARSGSSYSFGKRLRLAVNSLLTYSDLPPIAFVTMGVVMVVLPLLYGLIVILQVAVSGRQLPAGLTFVVLLLCALMGSLMLAIGVIGVYVFRIFQEVLARPRYLINETANVTRTEGHERTRS
jgi:dolichol-phosphate mannosyltransferase